ncbi:MAG TPA: type I 3-dehydroquinate dehydratase [Rectinemataceae bacterium]|nr:type I 3-dehydroquinate dehydratase [Rectinemataceae bacterium]
MSRRMIGEGDSPLVCAPLVGRTEEALLSELEALLPESPDAIEWRADFFRDLADGGAVVDMARRIKELAGDRLAIFTIRSRREGGQTSSLSEREIIERCSSVCRESPFEYVDCELAVAPPDIERLRDIAHANGSRVIASYHDFERTPDEAFIVGKFLEAERLGLDVAKVAVMPRCMEDVLVLLGATLEGGKRVSIPLITMSMGGLGALSRMIGGAFGSSLTFAAGREASAPGQLPIGELRSLLEIVRRSRSLNPSSSP